MKKIYFKVGLVCLFSGHILAQDCIIADYQFNANAQDTSGNNYHGIVNGATLTNDRNGNANGAYFFDGTGSYIELNSNNPIILTTTFTIAAWGRIDGQGGGTFNESHIFIQRKNTTGSTSAIGFKAKNSSGNIELAVRTTGNSVENIEYAAPSSGNWNHFVAVCTGDSLKLYLNGLFVAGKLFSQGGGDVTDIDYVDIGRAYYSGSLYGAFYGAMDDVKIYDCALTNREVLNLYSTGEHIDGIEKLFSVFPNPTTDKIKITSYYPSQKIKMALYNSLGQELQINVENNTIDLSAFDKGIYYLLITDKKGDIQVTKKVMKI
ncbi:MAG: LamG-like jellyroll fold domain-containing protein [Bacteroidia bacterium]